ncbi:ATP-binding protein [Streptomyces yunnanensis]|uniref:ATP-binding protein n=1 Tax=Streptomyces yunnanensis TaxID=156453 RepID=A0ABY8ABH0_9ACTN|nr:ATP-binding protein [Streptomyces yunnanensis]WEB42325.1 ATP-binding protein [Streptomyces yunnanensis]
MAVTVRPTGHPEYTQTLPCAAESAAPARILVRTALTAWGLHSVMDSGALVVTELVANAARHTRACAVRVTVTRPAGTVVRIAVVDTSRRIPEVRVTGIDDEYGRGLALIDALSQRWGYERLPWGKRVWAELRRESDPR